jgi:hypothetical protein
VGTTSQADNPSFTKSELDNATRYYFRVTAVNDDGYEGTGSKSIDITPTFSGPVWWVATTGSDNNGEGSSASPYASIRHALEKVTPGDTIMLKAGTYTGSENTNIVISGYDDGLEIFDRLKNLVITSEKGAESTIIDAEYSGRHFAILGDDSRTIDSTFQFIGLTFKNGRVSNNNQGGPEANGGSFLIHAEIYYNQTLGYDQGSKMQPKFKNCTFIGNEAVGSNSNVSSGGAIAFKNASAIFENCTFKENMAGFRGGAILVNNNSSEAIDTLWVRNSSFISNSVISPNNSIEGAQGGAINFTSGTNAVITNSLFEKNMVTSDHNNFGGAIYLHYDWFGGLYKTLRIENSRITKNIVKSNSSNNSGGQVSGGGIYAGSPFIMMNSIVDSNSSTLLTQGGAGTGGGILININNTNDFN